MHAQIEHVNLIKSDRSRQELSTEYLVARIGFDTAENSRPLEFTRSSAHLEDNELP